MRRFYDKTQVGKNNCLEWTGATHRQGYGHFRFAGKTHLAHRIAWELHYGQIPGGMDVCHKCDNVKCVNISHLFLGDHSDNMQDKIAKGRDHNLKKTHCPQGHSYSGKNLYVNQGRRACRICRNDATRAYRMRKANG